MSRFIVSSLICGDYCAVKPHTYMWAYAAVRAYRNAGPSLVVHENQQTASCQSALQFAIFGDSAAAAGTARYYIVLYKVPGTTGKRWVPGPSVTAVTFKAIHLYSI